MRWLWLVLLAAAVLAQNGEAPPDPNPEWPGQRAWCNNYASNPHKCECAKATQTDCKKPITDQDLSGNDGMSPRCNTWCRREKCSCGSHCQT